MNNMIWNRLKYVLSPQFDVYNVLKNIVRNRVADIGFGTGFGMHLFKANAKDIYGYEIDEDAIRFAQAVFPFRDFHFGFGDIVKGIEDGPFDFVTMIDVIEHIEKDQIALQNVKKIMATGGTFICSTPNRLSRYRKGECHFREYAPREFEALLKRVFISVSLRNHSLEPLINKYENPILAVCRNDEPVPQSK